MTLQEAQAPIDREIVVALIEATPETWSKATLDLVRVVEGGLERFRLKVSSPDEHCREVVSPTEQLQDAAVRLADAFASFGKVWASARYSIWQTEAGDWKFRADFTY